MLNVDSFFTKGSTHAVCQDYSAHGKYNGNPYVIIADGCSTAYKSEFGAQLLIRCAELTIKEFIELQSTIAIPDPKDLIERIITRKMDAVTNALELNYQTLCATLIFAVVINGELLIYARGDGVISYRIKCMHDGTEVTETYTVRLSYTMNAPYYLVYDINPVGYAKYKAAFGSGELLVETSLNGATITEREPYSNSKLITFRIDGVISLDYVMIASDGLESYKPMKIHTETTRVDVSCQSIVARATAFKQRAGVFVQRRLGMMEVEDKKNMIEHTDDVSIAAIVEAPDVQS